MHRIILYFFAVGLLAQACGENASQDASSRKNGFTPDMKTKEDSLYHDVMEGHDAGMANIGKVRGSIARIQHSLDSMQKLPAKNVDAHYRQMLVDLQKDLKNADSGMTAWMDAFKVDSATGNTGLRVKYLESEKVKVTLVKDSILSGLQRAGSLLK